MKPSIETLAMIRDYARGELNEQEMARVEDLLAKQPELQEEVLLAQLLSEETEAMEKQRLLQVIQEADGEAVGATPGVPSNKIVPLWKQPWFRLAAASVLLLLAFGLFWYIGDTPSADRFASFREEAYVAPPVSDAMRSGVSSVDWLSDANQYLQTNQYEQCLSAVESIPPSDSLYLYALLLKGHSHYKMQQYERAIGAFEELLEQPADEPLYFSPNADHIRWSRLLAALAKWEADKTPENRQVIERLLVAFLEQADRTDRYYEEAQQLQRLLN